MPLEVRFFLAPGSLWAWGLAGGGGGGWTGRVSLPQPQGAHQAPSLQREVDRNQELLTRIRQLQEREAEAEEQAKEQLERSRLCQQSLEAAGQRLREKEDSLAEAGAVRAAAAPRPPLVPAASPRRGLQASLPWFSASGLRACSWSP